MAEADVQEQGEQAYDPQEPQTGSSNAALAMELSRKPYYHAVEDVIEHTAACRADFDLKTMQMLDALHSLGRVEAACTRLKDVIGIMPRSHVVHWRGYLFKLLRDFDDEAYHMVKGKMAANYAHHLPWIEEPTDHQHMRPAAPNFVPGSLGWLGEVGPDDFAKVAAHPLHATAPAFDPGMPAWGWEPVPPMEMQEMFASGISPATYSFTPAPAPAEQRGKGAAASSQEYKVGAAGSSTDSHSVHATSAKKESTGTAPTPDVDTAAGPAGHREEGTCVRSEAVSSGEHEREAGHMGSAETEVAAVQSDTTDPKVEVSVAASLEHDDAGAPQVTDSFDPKEAHAPTIESGSVQVSEPRGNAKCISPESPTVEGSELQPPAHGKEGDADPSVAPKSGGDDTTSAKRREAEPSGSARRARGRAPVVSSRGSAGRNSSLRGGRGVVLGRGRGRGMQAVPRLAAPGKPSGGIGSGLQKRATLGEPGAASGRAQARAGATRPQPKTGADVGKSTIAGKQAAKLGGVQDKVQEEAGTVKAQGMGRAGARTWGRGGAVSRVTGSTGSADKVAASSGSATKATVGPRVWVAGGSKGRPRRWRPAAPWKR